MDRLTLSDSVDKVAMLYISDHRNMMQIDEYGRGYVKVYAPTTAITGLYHSVEDKHMLAKGINDKDLIKEFERALGMARVGNFKHLRHGRRDCFPGYLLKLSLDDDTDKLLRMFDKEVEDLEAEERLRLRMNAAKKGTKTKVSKVLH